MRMGFRRLAIVIVLAATGAAADGDDFRAQLTGTFGMPDVPELSCTANPVTITFSPEGLVMTSTMAVAIIDYEGKLRLAGDYAVVGQDANGLHVALDGESRLTEADEPVVWELRPTADGFCWGRTDWTAATCQSFHVRCGEAEPLS